LNIRDWDLFDESVGFRSARSCTFSSFAAFLKRPQNGGAAGQRDAVAAPFRSSISAVGRPN
jgi:hypothetical protein